MRRAWLAPLVVTIGLVSCGGKTDSAESGGSAGTGAVSSGGASSGGSGGTSFGGTSFGGTSFGGSPMGGAPGCGPTDPGGECASLGQVACLSAFPRCVPVYDDHCCPSCDPTGGCADCIDFGFHHCSTFVESSCTPGFLPACGQTPTWACQGGSAECPAQGPCNFAPGCTDAAPAGCDPTQCGTECHPVTAWSCGPTCSPSPIPFCDKGVPEAGPKGYTGYCIRAGVCGLEPGACPAQAPAHGSTCVSEGLVCAYSGFCAPTCTCTKGAWSCPLPPC